MTTLPSQIGPYSVKSEIGRGGMGVVYLATDSRLDRQVAIKALPEFFRDDAMRMERFEREAKTLAALNHPNVAAIYGVEEVDGARYLVMEYVDGETLADRLDGGPLPVDEALDICAQIAAGLEAAHDAGVIHRDLKPANIKITSEGRAKVLDFGLARTEETSSSGSSVSQMPTMTTPHSPTTPGQILGTAPYMSPEQARGRKVDKRSDIWSFGVVLYECLTGMSPFIGETATDSIGAILHKDVDLNRLPPTTPGNVRHVIERSLHRDRNQRLRDIGDARIELQSPARAITPAPVDSAAGRQTFAWIVAAVCFVGAVVSLGLVLRPSPSAPQTLIHAEFTPPEGFTYAYRRGQPIVSPDGARVAFIALDADGQSSLWVRDLSRRSAVQLANTSGAQFPFWSHDGADIAYVVGNQLMRMSADGGPADTICETPDAAGWRTAGGTWNADGVIVFSAFRNGGLFRVPASGGQPVAVTELDLSAGEFTHRYPFFLPDGIHFLFLTRRGIGGENGVSVGSLDGMTPKRILDIDSQAIYVDPGYVLYWRDGAVRAQRFDVETLDVVGEPFLIIPQTRFEPAENTAHFSASNNGVIVYHQGEGATAKSELLLHDRSGAVVGRVGEQGNYYSPRFSNDGQFVAVDNSGVQNNGDIWIYGVDSPVAIRLTSDPADESRPIWSPDDKRIAYFSGAEGLDNTFVKTIANPAQHEVLRQELTEHEFADWAAPDGRLSFHRSIEGERGPPSNLWLHSTQTGEAEPFLESPLDTTFARFLSGTDWFAYVSKETGQPEIYLQSLSDPATKRRLSVGGGFNPHWRRDGLELFYITPAGTIMSVQLENGPDGDASMPTPLFDANTRFEPTEFSLDYHVTADGQTFLVNTPIGQDSPAPMSLLLHWSPEDAR